MLKSINLNNVSLSRVLFVCMGMHICIYVQVHECTYVNSFKNTNVFISVGTKLQLQMLLFRRCQLCFIYIESFTSLELTKYRRQTGRQ